MRKCFYVLFMIFVLVGCASKKTTVSVYNNPSLTNKVWGVTSIQGTTIEYKNQANVVYLTFSEDYKVHGFAGCNNYGGSFTADGNKMTIQQVAVTKMSCPEFRLETQFLKAIHKIVSFSVSKKTLKFYDENGKILLDCVLVEEENK